MLFAVAAAESVTDMAPVAVIVFGNSTSSVETGTPLGDQFPAVFQLPPPVNAHVFVAAGGDAPNASVAASTTASMPRISSVFALRLARCGDVGTRDEKIPGA